MSLRNFAENIYNGNVSLDAAKQEQRKMESMLKNFIDYSPIKNVYKKQKTNILLNAREFYKGRREILIAFEENMFPLPKPYVFGKNEWEEKHFPINENYMPKTFKFSFLEKNNQTELSEKENELLDRDFGYKNIDELVNAFNDTKNDEECDELYDRIVKKLALLKKLVNTVSNIAEKERINNVIKNAEFVLNYVAYYRDFSDSDSDFSSPNFSDIKGKRLQILTSKKMLSKLPIFFSSVRIRK